jgi:hypothetical protein
VTGSPAEEAAALAATLRSAAAEAAAGARVDLAGVDGRVKRICDAVLALPPGDAAAAAPAMDGLVAALDALREALAPPDPPAGGG